MSSDITITITVDGKNYNLKGIPKAAFDTFAQNTKRHFPDAGDDAWANAITEMILSFTTSEAYFMTDIPPENMKALDEVMSRVGWTFEQFHAYLLTAVMKKGAVRLVSFREQDTSKIQLGTVIVTGLHKETMEKVEQMTQAPFERVMGLLFQGFQEGAISFSPEDLFTEASRSQRSNNSPPER